jgi:hypothetical protein
VSTPALASQDEAGDRFYSWQGESFWSVTTLIGGGVPKHGLAPWYAKMVAELVHADIAGRGPHARAHAALRRWSTAGREELVRRQAGGELKTVKLDKLDDRELALRYLKAEPERVRDASAVLGSAVHDRAEQLVLSLARETGEAWSRGDDLPDWPDELVPHMRSFVGFLAEWHPEYVATEATVFNRAQAYAGTLDAILRVNLPGVGRWALLVDYKSGAKIYPEAALQLAAYRRGEFIGLADGTTEVEVPAVDECAVLHVTPKGCRLVPVRTDDAVFSAFLYAREVYSWTKELSRTVLLSPYTPEEAPAP